MNVLFKYNLLKEPEVCGELLTCSVCSPMPECSPGSLNKLQSREVKGKLNCFWLFMLVMWFFTWYQLCCLSECGYIDIIDLTEIVTDTDHPDIYWIKT